MKKYIVKYINNDDDLSSVWVHAHNKKEAISLVEGEYWDVKEVISCIEE